MFCQRTTEGTIVKLYWGRMCLNDGEEIIVEENLSI